MKRPLWKLPHLICKNDEALRKAGVLACRFDTPYSTCLFTRYNNILWICWFFAKNRSNYFCIPQVKLDNPHCHISAYGAPLLEERLICLKSVKISYLAKEKSSSLTAACSVSRQHFWQNDKIVAIRTMGLVILFPTLLWKECVLSYLLKMAKSRKVFASLLK